MSSVIVIGAGMAGIGAATCLHQEAGSTNLDLPEKDRKVKITVLEARGRLGGRVFTDRSVGDGSFIERGAAWIHGAGNPDNPIANAARKLGDNTMFPTLLNDIVVYEETEDGAKKIPKRVLRFAMAERNEQEDRLEEIAEQILGSSSSSSSSGSSSDSDSNEVGPEACDISLTEALRKIGMDLEPSGCGDDSTQRRLLSWFWTREGIDCGANLEELSFRAWYDQEYDNHGAHDSGAGFGEALVMGGYDTVVNALAQGMPPDCVQYDSVVEEIRFDESSGGVVVTVKQNDVSTTMQADSVICTVPLGCLLAHDIKFFPSTKELEGLNFSESSDSKEKNRIRMGLLNWVVLKFSEPFWQQEGGDKLERVDDHDNIGWLPAPGSPKGPVPIEYTNLHEHSAGCLGTQFPGRLGREMENFTDEEITESVMTPLRKIYGAKCLEPVHVTITRWQCDPFARGSFSMMPVGVGNPHDASRRLAGPIAGKPWEDRLLFAGEATSPDHPGTCRGAYESGEREAKRFLKRLS